MPLAPGTRFGPYEVTGPLGVGGMGEVYRARDTKLNRDVALKVLPAALAQDAEYLARFQREAQVLASLNHPNIAAIYGIEDHAIVMELVPGQTLTGQKLPIDEALKIAKQIAEALEAAHDKGIIHRDLKPGNIIVTPEGIAKVLDFGLATTATATNQTTTTDSPTLTMRATQAGLILGTAGYMSPEQARGGVVDKRTDIWAFGVVLYELLTGRRLFHGDTISDTLAAVLKSDPDWSALPANTPPWLKRLLARCLERDKKKRLRDIGDAFLEESSQPGTTSNLPRWILPAAAAAVAVAAVTGWLFRAPKPIDLPHRSFAIAVEGLSAIDYAHRAVISPDGKHIAYVAQDKLWLRDLANEQARPLEGTENAVGPFWSPDSTQIAFAAGNVIKKTSTTGGVPFVLTNINGYRGGAWSPDGRSLVISAPLGGLYEVSASGGVAKPALPADSKGTSYFLQFLSTAANERILLASHGNRFEQTIQLIDLDKRTRQRLRQGAYPIYTPTGHILFQESPRLPGIWDVPFSVQSRETMGEATPLMNTGTGLSVSHDGTLLWVDASSVFSKRQLVWRDRTGKKLGIVGPPYSDLRAMALSPDDTRVAYATSDGGNSDIWIEHILTGIRTRFTFAPENESYPCWTPSGKEIIFTSTKDGQRQLLIQPADGSRDPRPVLSGQYTPTDWSPDGSLLLLTRVGENSRPDVWAMRRKPDGSFDPATAFLTSTFSEDRARFSPDGRFVIYHSNESGTDEVFLRAFPDGSGKRQISSRQGDYSRWSRKSQEIFYLEGDKMMAVPTATHVGTIALGPAVELFRSFSNLLSSQSFFDVTADGKRFLIAEPVEDEKAKAPAIHVIQNWPALLRQKSATP